MKRLILIFIFVSGINLFAQANFSLYIYKGKANYLKGYNQYLPSVYYIFNYILNINNYLIEKEYIYNYTNKKMYLLKDYYSYYYGSLYNPKRDLVLKYYDLNGKQRTNDYEFTIRTVKGTNRYGDEIIEDNYYDYTGKYINNDYLKIFSSWSIQSYENSLKLPNVINPKNIGLYDIWGGLLALGSEYQIYDDDSIEYNGYDYSGKDYILGTSYIIDLETKSKININGISKEEYEKELNKETEEMKSQISEKEKIIDKRQSELPYLIQEVDSFNNNKDSWIKNRANFYIKNEKRKKEEANTMATNDWEDNLLYKENRRDNVKNEIEKLENEIKELEKSIEELENIYKNRKNSELENKYIKIFREKLPELEDEYYYLGENSITTNSINFIPFKYLKPYFERDNIKTKEQFYKLINFENEK
ncbi:hypothetical protein EPJ74_09580 [Brachyspira aalborgi]|uniref:Uncharacterized protein n=1 Tax=Brachyspira aalborgi TaxID=29522 RepID=A0A5C8GBT0_9SPIR|nr:hypothetical protein [Brachyspira aalborgi]TXJ59354.1 hypothetical protein EPJ74_09580 [Brachyspira aalborgi]